MHTPAPKPTRRLEYEQMLLSRHLHLSKANGRRKDGTLERSAYILLSRIRVEGPMSIGELSEAFGLDSSTLNRQTAAALRSGLVERIPDPDGGIARKFRLTKEGERRLDEERDGNVRALDEIMADWSPEDIAVFADCVKRFNADIERLHGNPWPRPEHR
ncbi:MarR family winged helix-turn-helix transcriptional regulator [Streptomyces sp. NBC_01262]|jgi:DNA-binding MarR family transcriptional regulator|uniref:MarR family winged helix-turn-helix transcriptional regulator n=1 Tax=Streptomyces sp. NBC_01262 TaxID=2903803 RepID=UPI002E37D1FC|nr:MarR family transcriptional regulator [Streptomyces sp. NBC_01262]